MRYGFKLMSCKTGDHRSMIRRRQADSVHRAAAAVEKKIFRKKVEKFSKYFPSALEDYAFTIYREVTRNL